MRKNLIILLVGVILFLCFATNILAIEVSISNLPSVLDRSQEVDVDLFFSCSGCGDFSYFRGVFYPSGTNYFGFTKNNSGSWIGMEADRSLYFAIAKTDLTDASWSGKLKVKPDPNDSAYEGPGEYLFKVGRYSSSGDSSADWSNELRINLTGPTPTPTLSPTASPSPENKTPTPSPLVSTTPRPTWVKTASPKPSPSPAPQILGEETSPSPSTTTLPASPKAPTDSSVNRLPIFGAVLVSLGLIFTGLAGYFGYVKRKETPGNITGIINE